MQTHYDNEHLRREWLATLEKRADESKARGDGKITAGADGEPILAEWKADGIYVTKRPSDPHGILRISIGGGDTPVPVHYLTFRGDHGECVDLLRRALRVLEEGPQ